MTMFFLEGLTGAVMQLITVCTFMEMFEFLVSQAIRHLIKRRKLTFYDVSRNESEQKKSSRNEVERRSE